MRVQFRKLIYFVPLVLALTLSGCLGGGEPEETQSPTETADDLTYTQAAETIMAELTEAAPSQAPEMDGTPAGPEAASTEETLPPTSTTEPTETLPPTSTPEPTNTPFPTDTPLPSESPTATETPEPNWVLVYEDDFSSGVGGWPMENTGSVRMHYTRGGYEIINKVAKDVVWSVRSPQYDNTRVEVIASRSSGTLEGGYYGVICRWADGGNYYILAVGSDGWYGIGKRGVGFINWIREGNDTNSIVHTGNATNVIRADCVDDKIALYANGELLVMVEDLDLTAGSIGLAVGSRTEAEYAALFDDIAILEPEQ